MRGDRAWSQAELAHRSGLSRQLIHTLELNKALPSIQTSFRLAHTFGCKVEDLFEEGDAPSTENIPVQSIAPELPVSSRVNLAKVANQWIAFPTDPSSRLENGFSSTDGILGGRGKKRFARAVTSGDEAEKNLAIAGCDPALQIIREMLAPGKIKVVLHSANSKDALRLLDKKMVHIAGVHFEFHESDSTSSSQKNKYPKNVKILRYSTWEQGWVIRPGNPKNFQGVHDLTRPDIRFANREEGSGTRLLLEHILRRAQLQASQLKADQNIFSSHLTCAQEVAQGRADVALSLQAIASSLHLDFIPLAQVSFDLLIPKNFIDHPSIQALGNALQSRTFRENLASIPGYHPAASGVLL